MTTYTVFFRSRTDHRDYPGTEWKIIGTTDDQFAAMKMGRDAHKKGRRTWKTMPPGDRHPVEAREYKGEWKIER